MVRIIPALDRRFGDFGWLKTYWLFSFDRYHDPNNMHFGNLRVFNDDIVLPKSGFGTHPHREMEIVTIVLSGTVTHEDSMGNRTEIKAGEVQRMTAGTGVSHSEHNLGADPLNLYQIWFFPREPNLKPSYEQASLLPEARKNKLQAVVSGTDPHSLVKIHSDATIYLSDLTEGKKLSYPLSFGRGAFVYITSGEISVNGTTLQSKDQARLENETSLEIVANQSSEFIIIDVDLTV